MRRLLVFGLLLSACAPASAVKPYGSDVPSLDANGLPPNYSLCVRNKAATSAAIYDVHYGCQEELVFYLVERADLTQQEKADMREDMEKKAVSYTHETVVARHGADAVRATLMSQPLPPKAANRPN